MTPLQKGLTAFAAAMVAIAIIGVSLRPSPYEKAKESCMVGKPTLEALNRCEWQALADSMKAFREREKEYLKPAQDRADFYPDEQRRRLESWLAQRQR